MRYFLLEREYFIKFKLEGPEILLLDILLYKDQINILASIKDIMLSVLSQIEISCSWTNKDTYIQIFHYFY